MAKLNVNGRVVDIQVEEDTPLLWVLREQLGLTGTKYGCGVAQCGSCTVHVDGAAMRACAMPVSAFNEGQKIVTIEGLSPDSSHPIQQAWLALDVPQCGFCQPGMIILLTHDTHHNTSYACYMLVLIWYSSCTHLVLITLLLTIRIGTHLVRIDMHPVRIAVLHMIHIWYAFDTHLI